MRRRGRIARWARACLFGLAALATALVLTELAIRLVGFRLPPRMPVEKTGLLVQPNEERSPGIGLLLKPGARATTFYPGAEPGTGHEISYAINALGFRGPPFPKKKPKGLYRIALIGDSVTYGTGINYEDTIASRLQGLFDERLPGAAVQVINCGVPSTNTGQQVQSCRRRVLNIDPDLVLIIATIVDASGYGVSGGAPRERPWQSNVVEALGLTSG